VRMIVVVLLRMGGRGGSWLLIMRCLCRLINSQSCHILLLLLLLLLLVFVFLDYIVVATNVALVFLL